MATEEFAPHREVKGAFCFVKTITDNHKSANIPPNNNHMHQNAEIVTAEKPPGQENAEGEAGGDVSTRGKKVIHKHAKSAMVQASLVSS